MHIKQEHYQCDICRQDKPYMVYKDYGMLQKHFQTSHFPCKEPECIEMRVVVFSTEKELEYHRDKVHRRGANKGKFDAGNLLGVRIDDHDDNEDDYILSNSQNIRGGRGRGGMASHGKGHASKDNIGKDFTSIVGPA